MLSGLLFIAVGLVAGCGEERLDAPYSETDLYVESTGTSQPDDVYDASREDSRSVEGVVGGDDRIVSFSGLRTVVPAEWQPETPANPMRTLQMRVPGAGGVGGAGDAGLAVFAGIGGSVDSNIERWVGQFSDVQGRAVEPKIDRATVGSLMLTTVTLRGVFSGGMTPELGGSDIMMVQTIVERPAGDMLFIRLLGPAKTVEANRAAFDRMLEGLK